MRALEAVDRWCEELVTLREHAPRTVRDHRAHLEGVIRHVAVELERTPAELELAALTRAQLVRALSTYHAPQSEHPRAAASVARRIAALRSFCAWCVEMELLPQDVSRTLRIPRAPRRRPRALAPAAARLLLAEASRSRWAERDRLVVLLCLGEGLRLGELATLTLAGYDPGPPPTLQVHPATDRERTIVCGALTAEAITAYLPTRARLLRRRGLSSPWLLCTRNEVARTASAGGLALSPAGAAAILQRLASAAGVDASAQTLRATYASLALSGSHTPAELAAVLGISSPQAVVRYAEVERDALAAAAAAHPLAGLLGEPDGL